MQYEPIKALIGRYIKGHPFLRKTLYFLIDILLLRAWHIRKALSRVKGKLPENAAILDAGSGMGQYSWRLSRMMKGWSIKGVDINKNEISDCTEFFESQRLSGRVRFETADLTKLIEHEAYNFILTVDVMEHIEDDALVFRNFFMALRNNGILLISTPSDRGGSDAHDSSSESFIDEHVRNGYGMEEITLKLRNAGFTVTEARYTYGWPGSISWKLSMKYPVTMLNKSWLFFIILPFWYLVFFPVALAMNLLDVSLKHTTGTGLLITAEKQNK